MTFRNFCVAGTKGKSYEQRDLDTQMEMTVQLKIPICCSCAYFLLIRGKAGSGRERDKVARETGHGGQQTLQMLKRDWFKMVSA